MTLDPLNDLESLYREQSFVEAISGAQAYMKAHGATLSPVEYGRLYRIVGLCAHALGKHEIARKALREAYHRDPTDREVLTTYGQLLFEQGEAAEATRVFESLMLHQGSALTPTSRASVLKQLGRFYLRAGEPRRARQKLEKSLQAAPDDAAARDLLMKALIDLGEHALVIERRQTMIDATQDPQELSALFEGQARSYYAMGQDAEALDCLKRAYVAVPDPILFAELRTALEQAEAWPELARVLENQLGTLHGDALRDATNECVSLYLDRCDAPDDAARLLEHHLEQYPSDLQAFERLTRAHHSVENWRGLHDAYARMIQRTSRLHGDQSKLLGVLWRAVGELCRTALNEPDEALYAYRTSNSFDPTDEARARILDLTARVSVTSDNIEPLEDALDSAPMRVDIAERLGAALLKDGQRDRAYLVLRSVIARGAGAEAARTFVERLTPARPPSLRAPISQAQQQRYIRSPHMSIPLTNAFSAAGAVLQKVFSYSSDDWGLSSKTRVKLNDELLFNRVLTELCDTFGLGGYPDVHVSDHVAGMINASLPHPTFLIGPEMLSGHDERALRFIIARRLALLPLPFHLGSTLSRVQLKLVVACMIHEIEPDFEVAPAADLAKVQKALEKRLDAPQRAQLSEAVQALLADGTTANVDEWADCLEEEANRTGLLLCDNIETALRLTQTSPPLPDAGPRDAQALSLLRWSYSEAHHTLRTELRLAIS